MTTSATARSSPGGLGSAASSVKRSTTSEAIARSYWPLLRGGCGGDGRSLTRAGECGTDEVAEQRRRTRRPRLELRMELARHEPGVVGQLDNLDQTSRLERSRDDQASVHERRTV